MSPSTAARVARSSKLKWGSAHTPAQSLAGTPSPSAAPSRAHTVVTFNGKSFDVPFMEMRWLYHRLATPLPALRHLDLIHPARGLGALEDRVLGGRRLDDVPGGEIPSHYFDYLRSGDSAPLRDVLSHNCLDLASLAILTGLACELVDGGPDAADDASQRLGLGRVYERGGRRVDTYGCYERAAWETRHDWQQLLDLGRTPGLFESEALRKLAVHQEHRLKDTGAGAHVRPPGLRGGAHGAWSAGWADACDAAGTTADRVGCQRSAPHTDSRYLVGRGRLRGRVRLLLAFLDPGDRLGAILLHKPLDAPLGVDQLLLTSEEGVAVRADFESELFLGRSRLPRRAAGTTGLDIE